VILTLGGVVAQGAQPAPAEVRTFDSDRPGAPPAGFVFAEARGAVPDRWMVQRVGPDTLLAQLGDPVRGGGFSFAVLEGPSRGDVQASVRLRLIDGSRAGGLVWRYQDPENYYLASLEIGEQRVGVYRVTRGTRVRIRSDDELELDPNAWHTLKIVQERGEIRTYIGGIRVFDVRDRTLRELGGVAGGVGLWSTGDSVAHFDDFRVEELVGRSRVQERGDRRR
jgi:hypothetical protein